MTYSIVYSSKTGNTRQLAEALEKCLNETDRIYYGEPDEKALAADVLFIGFWTDQGSCDNVAKDFLEKVKDKKIYLFGTAGFGKDHSYFEKIISRIQAIIDKSNIVVGSYMCQGRMPLSVRERYEKIQESGKGGPNIEMLIENFDEALPHPTSDDVKNFINVIKKTSFD